MTGADYPSELKGHRIKHLAGVSLTPAFAGKSLERTRPIYFEHEGNRAIRDGKWKVVMNLKGPWELYHMEKDRTEQHDLSEKHPEVAEKLAADWEAWAERSDVHQWPGSERNNAGAELKESGADRRKPKKVRANG